jgi:hypothetical protein
VDVYTATGELGPDDRCPRCGGATLFLDVDQRAAQALAAQRRIVAPTPVQVRGTKEGLLQ